MTENAFPLTSAASMGAVVLLSLLLTGYELYQIFRRDFGRTLGNRHALFLFLLNIGMALVVWWFIHGLLAVAPTVLTTLATGLTFPALLRSRFTLYRTIPTSAEGDAGQKSAVDEVSLKMDEMYRGLQSAFYKEIDLRLARERLVINKQLRDIFTADQLDDHLAGVIGQITIDEDRARLEAKLQAIRAVTDARERHRQLANLLIQVTDRAELRRAIRDKSLTPPTG
jgi:hypothetical protein